MSNIQIYNTMSGTKEPFVTREEGKVGMYCCGPTVYNYIHLGNARPIVVFDTIRRYLKYSGYEVTYIQNFTDVDDKIINKANEEKRDPMELSQSYIKEYFKDADALNVMRATVHPTVSGHMQEIIDFVKALQEKGMAYEIDGDVYYSVSKFKDYGKLSKRNLEDLLDGARVEVDTRKQSPADFALWKSAKPGEPSWDSPWGPGRPGWHIECSAMSNKYLGESFDIHGGGFDLIFPHHENEIAQSEGRFGKPMAKYWVHNGFITINQEKMSKSLGNFFLLRDILKKFEGQVIRFYLLSVQYRSQLDFDDEKLSIASKSLERLKNCGRLAKDALAGEFNTADEKAAEEFMAAIEKSRDEFEKAMDDDFNTALAVATLFDMVRAINTYIANEAKDKKTLEKAMDIFNKLCDVLGIILVDEEENDEELNKNLAELLAATGEEADTSIGTNSLMEKLLEKRQSSRKAKDFATADKIRDGLKSAGIVVEDTATGAKWHKA